MFRLLLLITVFLTACGQSSQEKQDIAAVTCNILSEIKNTDGATRIKEINAAREKLGEDAFLLSNDVIQDSFKYGLCKELVLNNPDYDELYKSKEIDAENQLKASIEGYWFYRYYDDDEYEGYVLTAEFINQKLLVNKYDVDRDYNTRKVQTIFDYKIIDDTRLEAFGSKTVDNFIITVDKKSKSLSMLSAGLSDAQPQIKFIRPPNLSKDDISGRWLESSNDGEYETYFLSTRDNSSTIIYESLDLNHKKKTYKTGIETCDLSFTHGFILREKCDDQEDFFYFIASADKNTISLVFIDGGSAEEKRVSADYKLPSPPNGYAKDSD